MNNWRKFLYYYFIFYIGLNLIIPRGKEFVNASIVTDLVLLIFIATFIFGNLFITEERQHLLESLKDFIRGFIGRLFIAILAFMLASTVYSLEAVTAVKETLRFSVYIFIFFMLKYYYSDGGFLENLIKALYIFIFLVCIYGVLQYFTAIGLSKEYVNLYTVNGNRIAATFENPNSFGPFLVLFFFPALRLAYKASAFKEKAYFITISFLILANIIFTFSRNAWLGVIVGVILIIVFYSWKLVFPAGIISALLFHIPMINNRFKDFFDYSQNSSRINHWKVAVHMIADHLLLGVGNGNYVSYYESYILKYPELNFNDFSRFPTHNSYLKIISELGIIGASPFLILIFSISVRMKRYNNLIHSSFISNFYLGFFISTCAFLVMNIFDNLLFVPQIAVAFWIHVGIFEGSIKKV
jgi:putative inorganic carbon (hco3(-)) transporter